MRVGVTIYFIRHGETDWNAQSRYQGQADIPMNDTGRAQAQRNGETLRELLPAVSRYRFVASPLSRARATMEIVRNAMGLAPHTYDLDDRLKEINYGAWQGVLAADLPMVDAQGLAARTKDTFHWRPHGGESYADLMARAVEWLDEIEEDTVVAAHGGISRVL
ncbi:MAG TPA: histidine phosphatase family protein, partial [Hyphomicrobium sp.]|nr:histidine phosphatase family protein [Hyphomicrobium sp.]